MKKPSNSVVHARLQLSLYALVLSLGLAGNALADITIDNTTVTSPQSVSSGTSLNFTVTSSGTLTVLLDRALSNSGTIPTLTNNGTIYGDYGGINNFGTINTLTNSGTISTSGTYQTDSSGDDVFPTAIRIGDGAIIINLTNSAGGVISAYRGIHVDWGTVTNLTNNGSIVTTEDRGIYITGTVTNLTNNGLISSDQDKGIENKGTITTLINTGTIHTPRNAIYNNGGLIGTFSNSITGLITSDADNWPAIVNVGTINTLHNSGTISNSISNERSIGTLINNGYITAGLNGIYNSGTITTLTNNSTGTITSVGLAAINNDVGATIGTLNNSGTITPQNENRSAITNSGTIGALNNASSGSITSKLDAAIINNTGANIITLSNTGSIHSTDAQGIYNDGAIGTLTNDGSISSGSASAIYNNGGTITTFTNNSSITGRDWGVFNSGSIGTLTNSGTISGTGVPLYGYFPAGITNTGTITSLVNSGIITGPTDSPAIDNSGVITTLTNAQGRRGAASTPLLFSGALPTNYQIVINSLTSYGQLELINASGTTSFGFATGSTVRSGTYTSVIIGLDQSNFTSLSGTYGRYNWLLQLQDEEDPIWDLLLTGGGLDPDNTLQALRSSAFHVRDQLLSRAAVLRSALGYDSNTFGPNNISVSFLGRYTSPSDTTSEAAGVLVAAYKVQPQLRIGAFVDYAPDRDSPTDISYSDTQPTLGAFAVYEQNADLTGLNARIAAAFNQGGLTITRDDSLADTEAGSGKSDLQAYAFSAEAGYGIRIKPSIVAIPYVGIRFSDATRDGYTERQTDDVTEPLRYDDYSQRLTTALLGLRFHGDITQKLSAYIGLGAEFDLDSQMDAYRGTSNIEGLETFSVATDSSAHRLRAAGSLGLGYKLAPSQTLSAHLSVWEQTYSTDTVANLMLQYSIGF